MGKPNIIYQVVWAHLGSLGRRQRLTVRHFSSRASCLSSIPPSRVQCSRWCNRSILPGNVPIYPRVVSIETMDISTFPPFLSIHIVIKLLFPVHRAGNAQDGLVHENILKALFFYNTASAYYPHFVSRKSRAPVISLETFLPRLYLSKIILRDTNAVFPIAQSG